MANGRWKIRMVSNTKKTIGVLFGGMSSEKEVSLATGRYIYSLLDPEKFEGIPLFMDGKGQIWQIPNKLVLLNTASDVESRLKSEAKSVQLEALKDQVDLMFIVLLGKYGEDGCIQGVLELLGVPFTGSGVLASALGMEKKVHKKILEGAGFKVPKYLVIEKNVWQEQIANCKLQITNFIKFPCVVKPTREGSSIGVTFVRKKEDLDKAFADAFRWDREALVEEYIEGLEWMCVVWGNENPQAMLPTEVSFEGEIFTYEGKYMPGRTKTITPAGVSKGMIRKIQEAAVDVYLLIGCKGYGRIDGWVKNGEIIIGEPHTGTIMVPSSYVFQQAAKAGMEIESEFRGKKGKIGMSPREFVTRIIELAQEVHEEKIGPL